MSTPQQPSRRSFIAAVGALFVTAASGTFHLGSKSKEELRDKLIGASCRMHLAGGRYLEDLKDSMRERGLLNPIIVSTKGQLVAGTLRVLAALDLADEDPKWNELDAVFYNDKSQLVGSGKVKIRELEACSMTSEFKHL
jgi:hypothetical protein